MPDDFRIIKIRYFNQYSHVGFLSLAPKNEIRQKRN